MEKIGRNPADHFPRPSAARIASRPSVRAAGPGCRISADLISNDAAIPYCRDRIPSGSLSDLVHNDLLAAPRRDNDVGRRSDHVMWRDNSVFGGLLFSQFGKHILATGDLDEFRDPADAADERIIPLLEINLRLRPPMNRRRNVVKASFVNSGQAFPPYLPLRPKRQWCESSRECPQQMPFGCGSTWGSLMSLALSWAII